LDSDRKTPLPDDTSDTSQGRYNSDGSDSSKEENLDKTVLRPESAPSDNRQFSFFKPRDLIGKTVSNGKYQIEELIGEGGMGAVFKAADRGFGRKVAIKVLLPHLASNPLT